MIDEQVIEFLRRCGELLDELLERLLIAEKTSGGP